MFCYKTHCCLLVSVIKYLQQGRNAFTKDLLISLYQRANNYAEAHLYKISFNVVVHSMAVSMYLVKVVYRLANFKLYPNVESKVRTTYHVW